MKILDMLHPGAIIPDLKAQDKKGILEELATAISGVTRQTPKELLKVLMDREQLGSTGIGEGIGIPHGKIKGLTSMVIGFGLSKRGVDFDSIDGRPTHMFFTLITPDQSTGLHLKLLARISRILKNDGFKSRLMRSVSAEEIYTIIQNEDEEF
jgi:PTS system nitrogen regulatory IIA component